LVFIVVFFSSTQATRAGNDVHKAIAVTVDGDIAGEVFRHYRTIALYITSTVDGRMAGHSEDS
jgi:hypothetical protein